MGVRSAGQHYEAFLAVLRTGSITNAAAELGLPRPTVSRQLQRLETDLGLALVHRTTRRITPTSAGQRLFDRLQPLVEAWEEVETELRSEALDLVGTVRLSVLPLVAAHLAPVLVALQGAHPRLQIEVVANVRLVDLRAEGFDAAIWAGDPRDTSLVSRTLAVGGVGLFGSPAYLERAGTPQHLDELASHVLLRGHSGSGRPRVYWPLVDGGRVRVDGRFVTNDAFLLRQAAIEGLGLALLSELNTANAVASGTLVRVLGDVVGEQAQVRLLTAERNRLPLRVRTVIDALTAGFEVG